MRSQIKQREKALRQAAIERLDQMTGERSREARDFSALFLAGPKEAQIVEVPLAALLDEDRTFQYRVQTGDVTSLADDLKARGQTTPIFIRPHPSEGGKYQIISGFRRTAALKHLGIGTVRALVFPAISDTKATELAVSENLQRKDFSDLEKALLCRKLTEMGFTTKQVAELIGKGERTVQEYLSVLSAPPAVHAALHERRISFTAAIELARRGVSASLIRSILDKAGEDALSVHELRRLLRSRKVAELKESDNDMDSRASQRTRNGFRPVQMKDRGMKGFDLTVRFRSHRIGDYDAIIETFRRLVERVEQLRALNGSAR